MKTIICITIFLLSFNCFAVELFCSIKFIEDNNHKYILKVSSILGIEKNNNDEDVYVIDGVIDHEKYRNISLHYSIRASSCNEDRKIVEEFNKKGSILIKNNEDQDETPVVVIKEKTEIKKEEGQTTPKVVISKIAQEPEAKKDTPLVKEITTTTVKTTAKEEELLKGLEKIESVKDKK